MFYLYLFITIGVLLVSFILSNLNIQWVYAEEENKYIITYHDSQAKQLIPKVPLKANNQAPSIQQYPELPRGCEVTSLAMLLQFHGLEIDKLTLADQIKKDTTSYQEKNGEIYFGNPNKGFVGSMFSLDEPGYGVYHEPLYQLTKDYMGNSAKDLTSQPFTEVMEFIANKQPVVIITNITYKPLEEEQFQTWQTPQGPVEITHKQHAVLVTGYDSSYIYFNDPYDGKAKKAPKQPFIAAWEQMGKQAITVH